TPADFFRRGPMIILIWRQGNVASKGRGRIKLMKNQMLKLKIGAEMMKDEDGQDLIEYALMAGFVAVAAGAIMPGVARSISVVFSQVNFIMILAASTLGE